MYDFVKDIKFLEGLTLNKDHLNKNCFSKGFFICLVEDHRFYNDKLKTDGIYQYFRREDNKVKIYKKTKKPTGKNRDDNDYIINLNKEYDNEWKKIKNKMKYLLIKV